MSTEGGEIGNTSVFRIHLVFFRLCVILFTKQGQHDKEKFVLKLLAQDKKYISEKRVKFLYVYVDVQRELMGEFKDGRKDEKCADNSTASKVKGELDF